MWGKGTMKAFNSLMKGLSSGSVQHFCCHLGPALCIYIQTFFNLFGTCVQLRHARKCIQTLKNEGCNQCVTQEPTLGEIPFKSF